MNKTGIAALAAKGRGDDTMLVHIAPKELAALNKLAEMKGMHLTVNPKTGLPEIGILSSLLPMLVGGAATFLSGGALAPEMMPWMAAAAGGATGLLTKQPGQSGLLAALTGAAGGWGGAGLANSLTAAGANAAATQGSQELMQANAAEGAKNIAENVFDPYSLGGPQPEMPAAPTPAGNALDKKIADNAALADRLNSGNLSPSERLQLMGQGIQSAASNPLSFAAQNVKPLMAAGAPLLSGIGAPGGLQNVPTGSKGQIRPYKFNPQTMMFEALPPYAAAAGGAVPNVSYGKGGLAGLAAGRMLRGPGDGMSDSIPASIEGKHPAALADGEFVVPADVVSHLGNGSSEAGAKRLYSMLDRIRQARVGTKKQGRKIDPDRMLPA